MKDNPTEEILIEEDEPSKKDGSDFFALDDSSRKEAFNEFVGHMKRPREKMDDVPFSFDEIESEKEKVSEEQITDDDNANLSYFNYDPEHETTALFIIGAFDSFTGTIGMLMTDRDPERYMAFANRKPSQYYVDATAAMVKKYQAKLSLEAMFVTALAMVYSPVIKKIYTDKKEIKQQQKEKSKTTEEELILALNKRVEELKLRNAKEKETTS